MIASTPEATKFWIWSKLVCRRRSARPRPGKGDAIHPWCMYPACRCAARSESCRRKAPSRRRWFRPRPEPAILRPAQRSEIRNFFILVLLCRRPLCRVFPGSRHPDRPILSAKSGVFSPLVSSLVGSPTSRRQVTIPGSAPWVNGFESAVYIIHDASDMMDDNIINSLPGVQTGRKETAVPASRPFFRGPSSARSDPPTAGASAASTTPTSSCRPDGESGVSLFTISTSPGTA